jgi:hypothetical protein
MKDSIKVTTITLTTVDKSKGTIKFEKLKMKITAKKAINNIMEVVFFIIINAHL